MAGESEVEHGSGKLIAMTEATENNGAAKDAAVNGAGVNGAGANGAGGAKELPELNDVSQASDHVGPLKAAMRSGALALLVLGALSLLVWGLISGTEGLWGAGIGWLVGGGFMLLTVVIVLFSSNTSPSMTMGLILGSWLVKAAVLLGILFFLKDKTFYDTAALAVTVILSMVAVLAIETLAVTRTQKLYIS